MQHELRDPMAAADDLSDSDVALALTWGTVAWNEQAEPTNWASSAQHLAFRRLMRQLWLGIAPTLPRRPSAATPTPS